MSVYYLSRFGVNVVQVYLFVKNAVFHFSFMLYLCGTVVEHRSLTCELSLSCARPAPDG